MSLHSSHTNHPTPDALQHSAEAPLLVGYLGPPGSHSHQAAMAWADTVSKRCANHDPQVSVHFAGKSYNRLQDLMSATETQEITYGILPFENALEGSVIEVLEALGMQKRAIQPRCEFLFPVHHCLIALPHAGEIRTILSHPQALAQCQDNLKKRFGKDIAVEWATSTSEAVRRLKAEQLTTVAAIGTANAAERYGLKILEADVSDSDDNVTRFFVVSHPSQPWHVRELLTIAQPEHINGSPKKTSLSFGVPERPGALVEVLQIMRQYGLNMTKIESRPSRRRFGEYRFHVDVDQDVTTPHFTHMLPCLQDFTHDLEILGPYTNLGRIDLPHTDSGEMDWSSLLLDWEAFE